MENLTYDSSVPKFKTAVALGVFDGIHRGHQDVILCASSFKNRGLSSAVFTFSTKTVTSKGNGRLDMLISDELKLEMLNKLGVDYVYSPEFNELKNLTAEDFVEKILLKKLNASIAVCGENFRFGKGAFGDSHELSRLCSRVGIDAVVIPFTYFNGAPISSTEIRRLIREGSIDVANVMLGYDFQFRLKVVRGNALGRTLEFPTINQYFSPMQVTPRFGVYASCVSFDGKEYPSVTNIGVKPTIGGEKFPLAETHIIDFNGDLYGKEVTVYLKKFIRPEQKFDSIEQLKSRLFKDLKKAKEFLYFTQSKGGYENEQD
ncbi:MAG: bifunctional riboflavin kinase/FAD synthetase [Oscillospiraceae bacterium]